jgi:hypothetical protein
MSDEQVRIKLRKEALEAALIQIEYLRGIKKDALLELCKGLDGKVTQDDVEEIENLFRSLDVEEKNEVPFLQLGELEFWIVLFQSSTIYPFFQFCVEPRHNAAHHAPSANR